MNFEWDETKRLANITRHGIDFLHAVEMFDGRAVLVMPSPYQAEDRHLATGLLDEQFVTVVYTIRADAIRIISARSARREERREYYANYA
jgi:uncharacterized protein